MRYLYSRRRQAGFLLIEVMISMVVIILALSSLSAAFQQGLRSDRHSALATAAVNIGQETIERLKAMSPEEIHTFAGTDDIFGPNGEAFHRDISIAPNDADSTLLDVTVVITWTEASGRQLHVSLYTKFLLAPFSNYALHPEAG